MAKSASVSRLQGFCPNHVVHIISLPSRKMFEAWVDLGATYIFGVYVVSYEPDGIHIDNFAHHALTFVGV